MQCIVDYFIIYFDYFKDVYIYKKRVFVFLLKPTDVAQYVLPVLSRFLRG